MVERLDGDPCGAGWFAVPSASMLGETWTVRYQASGLAHCFCPAFERRGACRHTAAVDAAVRAEAMTPSTPEQRARAASRLAQIAEEFAL